MSAKAAAAKMIRLANMMFLPGLGAFDLTALTVRIEKSVAH
jgi:hypothetical protein